MLVSYSCCDSSHANKISISFAIKCITSSPTLHGPLSRNSSRTCAILAPPSPSRRRSVSDMHSSACLADHADHAALRLFALWARAPKSDAEKSSTNSMVFAMCLHLETRLHGGRPLRVRARIGAISHRRTTGGRRKRQLWASAAQ